MAPEPILLPDDGLRLIRTGQTKSGGYRIVSQENPELIALTIYEKKRRQQVRLRNEQAFS